LLSLTELLMIMKFPVVKDNWREERLAKAGFKIVRFTDEEVLKNMAGVISELERIIGEIEASTPLIPRQRGTRIGKLNRKNGYQ